MNNYKNPWQKAPSEFIRHALEHAEKDTSFDKQMAYLILDVGVEMTYKVFLQNYAYRELKTAEKAANKEGREITFHQLVEIVKQVANEKFQDSDIDFSDYFHNLRNKLYHEGESVTPDDEPLRRYSELAKKQLQILLDVDLTNTVIRNSAKSEKPKKQIVNGHWWMKSLITHRAKVKRKVVKNEKPKEYIISGDFGELADSFYSIDELVRILKYDFAYFQESCAIIAEQLHPNWATRQFAMQFNNIWQKWPDRDSYTVSGRAGNQAQRLKHLNDLCEANIEDYDLVDLLLQDITNLFVHVTLKEINTDSWEAWEKYVGVYMNLVDRDSLKDPNSTYYYEELYGVSTRAIASVWGSGIDTGRITTEQIIIEYREIDSWLVAQFKKMDNWINDHIKNIPSRNEIGRQYWVE